MQYDKGLEILNAWQNKDYQFAVNDCVSFIMEVGKTLKLKMPDRKGFENHPYLYVKKMNEMNK